MDREAEGLGHDGGRVGERDEQIPVGPIRSGLQGRLAGVRTAVDPGVLVAVLPRKPRIITVGARQVQLVTPVAGHVATAPGWLRIEAAGLIAAALDRLGQQRERHGRLQQLAGHHRVVEHVAALGRLAAHVEYRHRRAPILREVVHQHEGVRGVGGTRGGDVQIVARGVRAAAVHDGMFLVGIIARLVRSILIVDGSARFERVQRAAALAAGQHDLARVGRPDDRVAAKHGRPVGGGETELHVAGIVPRSAAAVGAEPPDIEQVAAGDGVDGDDRAQVGRDETADHRVNVGAGIVGCSDVGVDVPGPVAVLA